MGSLLCLTSVNVRLCQDLVASPGLFLVYSNSLGKIIQSHGFMEHQNASATKLMSSAPTSPPNARLIDQDAYLMSHFGYLISISSLPYAK